MDIEVAYRLLIFLLGLCALLSLGLLVYVAHLLLQLRDALRQWLHRPEVERDCNGRPIQGTPIKRATPNEAD